MNKIIISLSLLLTVFISSCIDISVKTTRSTTNSATDKEKGNWVYSEDIDEMTDMTRYSAECKSLDIKKFSFPYDGGSTLSLFIRNMNGTNEAVLYLDKGVIDISIADIEYIRVRFDGGKTQLYSYNSAFKGIVNYAFLNRSEEFISGLKSSKSVKIEVPVLQESRAIFNFNTEGLVWNH